MLRQSFRATTWAVALAAISALTLPDSPTDGARALLGWTPPSNAGSSNLRLARPLGPVSAERALAGRLTTSEQQAVAGEAIQIRSRAVAGGSALLGH
jgi:hypothetical protein